MPLTIKPQEERRRRQRFRLRCPVRFSGNGMQLEGSVINVSSHGFLCTVAERIRTPTELRCTIDVMPSETNLAVGLGMSLECDVVALRCEASGDGYEVACVIRDYTVARNERGLARSYVH